MGKVGSPSGSAGVVSDGADYDSSSREPEKG
jgi:hypothetical protein